MTPILIMNGSFDFKTGLSLVWFYQEKKQYLLKKTGHNYPFSNRDYPVANKNYIKLPLKAGEVKECLVRLDYRLSATKSPQNLNFKLASRVWIDEKMGILEKLFLRF